MINNGFSLIELIVSISIMSITLMGMMSMFQFFNRQYSDMASRMGVISLTNELSSVTNGRADCSSLIPGSFPTNHPTFYTQAIGTSGFPIQINLGGATLSAGANLQEYRLRVDNVRFKMLPGNFYHNYTTGNRSTYFGHIEVALRKSSDTASGGYALRPRTLGNFALRMDNTGQNINGCVGITSEEMECLMSASPPNSWNPSTNACQ